MWRRVKGYFRDSGRFEHLGKTFRWRSWTLDLEYGPEIRIAIKEVGVKGAYIREEPASEDTMIDWFKGDLEQDEEIEASADGQRFRKIPDVCRDCGEDIVEGMEKFHKDGICQGGGYD